MRANTDRRPKITLPADLPEGFSICDRCDCERVAWLHVVVTDGLVVDREFLLFRCLVKDGQIAIGCAGVQKLERKNGSAWAWMSRATREEGHVL